MAGDGATEAMDITEMIQLENWKFKNEVKLINHVVHVVMMLTVPNLQLGIESRQ